MRTTKGQILVMSVSPRTSLAAFLNLGPFRVRSAVCRKLIARRSPTVVGSMLKYDLVPTGVCLSRTRLRLTTILQHRCQLRRIVSKISDRCSLVLVSYPPSLKLLSVGYLITTGCLIVPVRARCGSIRTAVGLLRAACRVTRRVGRRLRIVKTIPAVCSRHASRSHQTLRAVARMFRRLGKASTDFGSAVIFPPIPHQASFTGTADRRLPLTTCTPGRPTVRALTAVTRALDRETAT